MNSHLQVGNFIRDVFHDEFDLLQLVFGHVTQHAALFPQFHVFGVDLDVAFPPKLTFPALIAVRFTLVLTSNF